MSHRALVCMYFVDGRKLLATFKAPPQTVRLFLDNNLVGPHE